MKYDDPVLGPTYWKQVSKEEYDAWLLSADAAAAQAVNELANEVCDCCGRQVPTPFHHDAHDDSGHSWDYCQECYDVGCDLITCSLPR